jgi:Lrp/AsnC family transcriptional regulator, regulator of ectoine-degradation genes
MIASTVAGMRNGLLDPIDVKILAAVQREGRLAKAALSERVNLSPTPCWTRLRRLEELGLIRGYHADIALDRVARFASFVVEVTLKQHRYEDFQRFETAIARVDAVVECVAIGGGIDYVLKVVAADIESYQQLIDDLLVREIGIERYFTYVVTRTVKARAQAPVTLVAQAP